MARKRTEKQAQNRHGPVTAHLTPWQFKPGQSGNVNGRPPKLLSLLSIRKDLLGSPAPEEALKGIRHLIPDHWKEPITWGQALELRNLVKALSPKFGDIMAMFIAESIDGRATFRIESSDSPAVVNFDFKLLGDDDLREILKRLVKAKIDEPAQNGGGNESDS